jgi:hypothetical protein
MSDCLHCDINELVDGHLQQVGTNIAEVAAKVTESLADLILLVPVADQSMMMADILANLGHFVLEKSGADGESGEPSPRRSSH